MNESNIMEIKFSGENIYPESIDVKELAEVLVAFEQSLTSIILKDSPSISIDQIVIGLVQIDKGSAKLKFKSALPVALTAFISMSSSISKNDFSKIPTILQMDYPF